MPIDETGHDADGQPIAIDPDAAAADTGHTFPAPALNPPQDDDPDPLTYADSLDSGQKAADENAPASDATDAESEADDDSNAPQQMSLF